MMTFVMRTPGAQGSSALIPRASEFGGGKRSGTLFLGGAEVQLGPSGMGGATQMRN